MNSLVRLRLIPYNLRLIEARREKSWTQKDLALLVGIHPSHVSAIETLRAVPTPTLMSEITDALQKDRGYLFPEALLKALREDVFARRLAEIGERQLMSLADAKRAGLLPTSSESEEALNRLMDRQLLAGKVNEVLSFLCPRERRVIELRFGLDDRGESRTLEQVGKEIRITGGRVQQIEAKALRKLRHPSRSKMLKMLKDFLE